MKKLNALILFMSVVLFLSASYAAESLTPLPKDMKIEKPGADIPPKIANLSGIWEGYFNNGVAVTIVIEKITGKKVTGIYSFGGGGESPAWERMTGEIKDGTIVLDDPDKSIILTPSDNDPNLSTVTRTNKAASRGFSVFYPIHLTTVKKKVEK